MNEEELERTNLMKTMIIETENDEEDISIVESIEEFEDKIDYLDISDEKKNNLRKLCQDIKEETNEKTKEYLFNLLQKEVEQ